MSIVRKTKASRPLVLESVLFDLRDRSAGHVIENASLPNVTNVCVRPYQKNDREANAMSLRILWPLFRDASEFMDLLQRFYLGQVAGRLTALTEVMSAEGQRYVVTSGLDYWRTHKPKALGKFLSYDTKLYHTQLMTEAVAEDAIALVSEYCETMASDKNLSAVMSVHHPQLLAKLHKSRKPDQRWSMLSVNVDNEFTWSEQERPIYRRRVSTMPPAGLTDAAIEKRLNAYQDSIRLLGENLDTHGCAYDRPALNVVVAVMQEVSYIIYRVLRLIREINIGIMNEAAAYRGFHNSGKSALLEEPKSMRYAAGITVSNAVSPVHTRQFFSLENKTVAKWVAAGFVNVDTPRLCLRMKAVVDPLPRNPDYGPLWERGRMAIRRAFDPTITELVEAYQKP